MLVNNQIPQFFIDGENDMTKFIVSISFLLISRIAAAECLDLYNHQFQTLQGKLINLCDYQYKPILVVNTASKGGFTPQFEELEAMYEKYQPNLLIIGFPSNDFRQELESNKQIADFYIENYHVSFPLVKKSSVSGPKSNTLYKQLEQKTGQTPSWSFYKYLILPNGRDVFSFNSDIKPNSPEIMSLLKPYL
jgi:glutathione peroxidase